LVLGIPIALWEFSLGVYLAVRSDLPRVFRTVEFVLFHAAACSFKYSMRTWCGVR
jgi:hypothetical protein